MPFQPLDSAKGDSESAPPLAPEEGEWRGQGPCQVQEFAAGLARVGYTLTESSLEFLYRFTAGRLSLAHAVLSVTGTHGVRELISSRSVSQSLAQELAQDWERLGDRGIHRAALCASVVREVVPSSLAAAQSAFGKITADSSGLLQDSAQLILDLVELNLLDPLHDQCSAGDQRGAAWTMPDAIAVGLRAYFARSLDLRALRAALVVELAETPSLLGEQLYQVGQARLWSTMGHIMASRHSDMLEGHLSDAEETLNGLSVSAQKQIPLLKFMRMHVLRLSHRRDGAAPGEQSIGSLEALEDISPEIVLELRSLRSDYLSMLTDTNEVAVTAAYVVFAMRASGRNADAVAVGERAIGRIKELIDAGKFLTKQAADFFHYQFGIALSMQGRVLEGSERLNAAASTLSTGRSNHLSLLASEYASLMWMLAGGYYAVERSWSTPGATLPGSYLRALRHLDLLEITQAERLIAQHESNVADTPLWPLLAMVESCSALLRNDRHRWHRRMVDLSRSRLADLRYDGLGKQVYLRIQSEILMAGGKLQQMKSILDELPAQYVSHSVTIARMWLIAGDYERVVQVVERSTYSPEIFLRDLAELKLIRAMALWGQGASEERVREALWAAAELCAFVGTLLPLALLPERYRDSAVGMLEGHSFWSTMADQSAGDVSAEELMERVQRLPAAFPDAAPVVDLTQRELEVLRLLVSEWSMHQIAEHERRALPTVKKQAQAIYRKLGVTSREAAVRRAQAMGFFS